VAVAADDRFAVFSLNEDPFGTNPDLNQELFHYDIASASLIQVTDTVDTPYGFEARLSGDGQLVALSSSEDLVPGQNPGGELRAFLYDVGAGEFTQVTGIPGPVTRVELSDDGSFLALVERINNSTSNLWRVEVATLDAQLIANPIPTLSLFSVSIDGTGNRIAFESEQDLVPGGNSDGNREVFVYDAAADVYLQITDSPGNGSGWPSLSADGRRIAFHSGDTGSASSPLSVFVGDLDTGVYTALTTVGRSYFPVLSADGQRVVFWGETDPTGGNPALDTEFFLAECPELGGIATIPTASGTGLALLAVLLAGGATFLLRRRRHA
jgi:Tol biopolymer transport system component